MGEEIAIMPKIESSLEKNNFFFRQVEINPLMPDGNKKVTHIKQTILFQIF